MSREQDCVIADLTKECQDLRIALDLIRTTLRDQFAMSCPDTLNHFKANREMRLNTHAAELAAYCKYRYEYADAMLAAKEGK